jgi:hypothetical protein
MAKVDTKKIKRAFLGKDEWGKRDVFEVVLLAIFIFTILFIYLKLNNII